MQEHAADNHFCALASGVEISPKLRESLRISAAFSPADNRFGQILTEMRNPRDCGFADLAESTEENESVTAGFDNCFAALYRDGQQVVVQEHSQNIREVHVALPTCYNNTWAKSLWWQYE